MSTIWKFPLPIRDDCKLYLPSGALFISAGEQNSGIVVWAIVPPSNDDKRYYWFHIRGTGHALTGDEGTFIDTVQMSNGFVWHVFVN